MNWKMYLNVTVACIGGCAAMLGGLILCQATMPFGIATIVAGGLLYNQAWHQGGLDEIPGLRHLVLGPIPH